MIENRNMDIKNLNNVLSGRPKYRKKQAEAAVFQNLIGDWTEATSLPLKLQEELNKKCPPAIDARLFVSRDKNTAKALITLKDGLKVESVLMRHKDSRNTVCVSSQIGCPLGCLFCATGKLGFKRNLEPMEIVEQVLFFARLLKKEKKKITNVVFMGMGEPFLNYENALEAIKILNNKDKFCLGARHMSISTIGITEGIKKLENEGLEVNLAISLHAADDKLRSKIVPLNKKYPVGKILAAVDEYIKKTRRKVMFEYIMIKGVNDSDEDAEKLVDLLKGRRLCFVNLISYNPTGIFKPSPPERIGKFREILEKADIVVTERYRFGREIKAACGQLIY